nr:DUF262 domain-containing protein [Janibacter melonis]
MALPEFQRPFVWDPNQVLELLDSVSNGWPIGTFLVLRGPQPFEVKQIQDGPLVSRSSVDYYLLDGQQRVTALFHALTDTGDFVYYLDLEEEDELGRPSIKWARRGAYSRKQGIPWTIKIQEVTNREAFAKLTSELPSARAAAIRELALSRLGYLAHKKYAIPSIMMMEDIELEALTRIFETLNRTGIRLDAFDLMVALLYPHGFNLRDAWESAQAEFRIIRDYDVAGLEILKVIATWQRDEDRRLLNRPPSRRVLGVRQRDILNISPELVKSSWSRAIAAYVMALRFLSDQGVADGDSIPSDAMTLTIANLLDAGHPREEVARWYWRSICRQSYAQGANTQVVADLDRFEAVSSTSIDRQGLFEALNVGLLDFARRNRILRIGLRGLLVISSALDPITGDRLMGPIREVSLPALLEGRIQTAGDARTADLMYVTERSLAELRRRKDLSQASVWLNSKALNSQGLTLLSPEDSAGRGVRQRVGVVAGLMEARI